jgi:hypothetical protein
MCIRKEFAVKTRTIVFGFVVATLLGVGLYRNTVVAGPRTDDTDAAHKIADEIVDKLRTDDATAAIDVLKRELPMSPAEKDQVDPFFTRLRESIVAKYGKPIGDVEYIGSETAGKSLLRFTYVEKFERQVYVWRFTFYKASKEWKLHSFSSNEHLDAIWKSGS